MYKKPLSSTSKLAYQCSTAEFLNVVQEISRKNKKLSNFDRAFTFYAVAQKEYRLNSEFVSTVAADGGLTFNLLYGKTNFLVRLPLLLRIVFQKID